MIARRFLALSLMFLFLMAGTFSFMTFAGSPVGILRDTVDAAYDTGLNFEDGGDDFNPHVGPPGTHDVDNADPDIPGGHCDASGTGTGTGTNDTTADSDSDGTNSASSNSCTSDSDSDSNS